MTQGTGLPHLQSSFRPKEVLEGHKTQQDTSSLPTYPTETDTLKE